MLRDAGDMFRIVEYDREDHVRWVVCTYRSQKGITQHELDLSSDIQLAQGRVQVQVPAHFAAPVRQRGSSQEIVKYGIEATAKAAAALMLYQSNDNGAQILWTHTRTFMRANEEGSRARALSAV